MERVKVTDLNKADISSISPNDLYLKSTFLTNISSSFAPSSLAQDLNLYDCFKSNSFKMSSFIDDFLSNDRHVTGQWTFNDSPEQNTQLSNSRFINEILLNSPNRNDCITLSGNGYYSTNSTLFPLGISSDWVSSLSVSQYSIPNLDYVHRIAAWIYNDLMNKLLDLSSTKYAPSYVGQIIHSTTFNSEAQLKQKYGLSTSWKQHDGYSLRGVQTSDELVKTYKTHGNAAFQKDGGDNGLRTIPIIEHSHKVSHKHSVSKSGTSITPTYGGKIVTTVEVSTGETHGGSTHLVRWSGNYNKGASSTSSKTTDGKTVRVNDTGSDSPTVDINQAYKNVYIWERIL